MRTRILRAVTLMVIAASAVDAQEGGGSRAGAGALRVFLDCDECDDDYIRTETPWVAFVRDRTDADVHVLVTRIGTGAGGSRYTINLVGANTLVDVGTRENFLVLDATLTTFIPGEVRVVFRVDGSVGIRRWRIDWLVCGIIAAGHYEGKRQSNPKLSHGPSPVK
jgi:hypothetical protein